MAGRKSKVNQNSLSPASRSIIRKLMVPLFLCLPFILVLSTGFACRRNPIIEPTPRISARGITPGYVATQLARPSKVAPQVFTPNETRSTTEPVYPILDTQVGTPIPSGNIDQYMLDAWLDFDLHQLDVSQVITFTNRTGEALSEIWLVVEADRQDGVFDLLTLSWNELDIKISNREKGVWQVKLPAQLETNENGILKVAYRLTLLEGGGVLGYTHRQVNFGDWYVRIPPFKIGSGWSVHVPGAAGEHNVYEEAGFKVEIDLGPTGRDLVVAASVPATACGENTLCYEANRSRNFAWSVSKDYQVLEAVEGGVLIQQFFFAEHNLSGQAALEVARDAVRIFQDKFGPYRYPGLTMVEAEFFDGMEYSGLFFLGEEYFTFYDGTPKGYLVTLTAHEIAHNWWFSMVGNDQALEPWLDEALATYSELIFYQEKYPELEDWWWEYRVLRFQPGGDVDSTIYDTPGFRPYVNAIYLRGAQFLQELRVSAGDGGFMKILHEYFTANDGIIATAEDFFVIVEKHLDTQTIDRIRSLYFAK